MSEPIGPLPPDSPRAELATPGVDDDHRVAFIRATDVARTWNRIGQNVRMKCANHLAPEGLRGTLDLLPVARMDPEATRTATLVPSVNKSHDAHHGRPAIRRTSRNPFANFRARSATLRTLFGSISKTPFVPFG